MNRVGVDAFALLAQAAAVIDRRRVREEFDEYRGRMARFRDSLESGVPRSLALLDRTIATLDSYVDRPAPVEASPGTSPQEDPR